MTPPGGEAADGPTGTAGSGALVPRASLPPEIVAEIRMALAEARASSARDGAPFRELAEALRANAEAMRRVQETQERIARAVDRSDRSEAVIQSTQALNETFRGVRRAQDALVARLEREERRPLRAAILAGALVLLVGGGAAAVFLLREDGMERRIEALRAQIAAVPPAASPDGAPGARERELLDRLASIQDRAARSEADRETVSRELDAVRSAMEGLRREREAALARDADERRRWSAEVALLEQSLAQARREAAEARERAERAEARSTPASGAGPPPGEEAAPAVPAVVADPSAPGATTGATPASPGPEVPARPAAAPPAAPSVGADEPVPPPSGAAVRDAAQVRRLLDGLNALLAGIGGRETYAIVAAEAVDARRLVGVTIEARRGDGLLLKRFTARECRVVLVAAAKSLEIRLRDGAVSYLGNADVPFLDGRYTASLAVDAESVRLAANPLIAEM